jgi:hypothetical protein
LFCSGTVREAGREDGSWTGCIHEGLEAQEDKYKKFSDYGVKRLHPARFNPLPTGDPQSWADQNPVKREQVMKNLYMAHYGVGHGQVDTKTIVKV